jgi:hypothetical protein
VQPLEEALSRIPGVAVDEGKYTEARQQNEQALDEFNRGDGAQGLQLPGVPIMFVCKMEQVLPRSYLLIIPARAPNENPKGP